MRMKLNVIIISLLSLVLALYTVQAQTSDCTIDVQPIVAKLIEAQTAAASGKQTEALQQITDAKADLEAIETNCGAETIQIPLKNTFSTPDESFTFNYPEGWITGEFAPTLEIFGEGGRALIANNEQALAALTKNVDEAKFAPDDQAAIVIVGTPNGLLYSLGIYDETSVPKNISDIKTLTEYMQLAIKDGPLFDEISDPVYEGQSAQFKFSDKEFDGTVMVKLLDGGKYALTLVLGGKGKSTTLSSLASAILTSIH